MKDIHPVSVITAIMALLCIMLILRGHTPWLAILVVSGSVLAVVLVALAALLLIAGKHRAELWTIFVDTLRQDLSFILDLWRMVRRTK